MSDTALLIIDAQTGFFVKKVGVDHVAFGSDFDGAMMPHVLSDASKLPVLVEALLNQGYADADVEKISVVDEW